MNYNTKVDVLLFIKSLVLRERVIFTEKARIEMETDNLLQIEVLESILNARRLRTKISTSPYHRSRREKVFIFNSKSFQGIPIYTNGVLRKERGEFYFYVFLSAKRSTNL